MLSRIRKQYQCKVICREKICKRINNINHTIIYVLYLSDLCGSQRSDGNGATDCNSNIAAFGYSGKHFKKENKIPVSASDQCSVFAKCIYLLQWQCAHPFSLVSGDLSDGDDNWSDNTDISMQNKENKVSLI